MIELLPLYLYYALFLVLSLHGLHRALLLIRLSHGRVRPPAEPDELEEASLPPVTVQLPIYNERYVAERLVASVAELDWPRDRLEIQVLDDSNDDTVEILRAQVEGLGAHGIRIVHIRRGNRQGYKAGALAAGLAGGESWPAASGEFVAVFDADFLPNPDFLKRTVPLFAADSRLAVVQARWAHINRRHSLLTRLQAVFLDAHFAIEHEARRRMRHFLNFNGTAGVWRKRAIHDAGGWSHDTLTEDLDLSYRSQLAGHRFTYVDGVAVPSELPIEMNAFKSQQHRWSKGSIETARKLLPSVLRSRDLTLDAKLEGCFHLVNNLAYVIMFCVSLLALPVARLKMSDQTDWTRWFDAYLVGVGILPVIAYFLVGQLRTGQSLVRAILLMPAALALGIGIALNNTKAVVEALIRHRTGFVRTPKYRVDRSSDSWVGKRYFAGKTLWPLLEIGLGVCCSVAVWLAIANGNVTFGVLMILFAAGYLYVGFASLLPAVSERFRRLLTARRDDERHSRTIPAT